MGTYRVDEELYAAVAAKAAERGDTVTDLIIQRFQAYIRGAEMVSVATAVPVAESPVYTHAEAPPAYEEPPEPPPCRHPVAAVNEFNVCECGTELD